MPKEKQKIEKEKKELSIEETLDLITEKREEKNFTASEIVERYSKRLPEELKKELENDYQRLNKKLDGSELDEEIEILANRIEASYMESKLGIPNGSFSRFKAMAGVDEIFRKEKLETDDLKKIARISFDLNGLKPVNDLNGGVHEFGDKYLRLTVDIIEKSIKEWVERQSDKYEYLVSRDGGDEFGVIITGEKPLEPEVLSEIISEAKSNLRSEDTSKILDFNREEVLLNFTGVSEEEFTKKYGSDINKLKEDFDIPLDYEFRAEISAGASTLYDGLVDPGNDPKDRIIEEDTYGTMRQKGMGGMFSTSDRYMNKDKKERKEKLPEGNEYEIMEARVYARNEREAELTIEIKEFKDKIGVLEKDLVDLKEIRKCPHCGQGL